MFTMIAVLAVLPWLMVIAGAVTRLANHHERFPAPGADEPEACRLQSGDVLVVRFGERYGPNVTAPARMQVVGETVDQDGVSVVTLVPAGS